MTTKTQLTRDDYMSGKCTHQEYYESVAKTARLKLPVDMLSRVKVALDAGDEHLNTIPLGDWDGLTNVYSGALAYAFKKHGDSLSLAGGCCAFKALAKRSVENGL